MIRLAQRHPDVRTTGAGRRWQPPRACACGPAHRAHSRSSATRRALRLHSMQTLTCYAFSSARSQSTRNVQPEAVLLCTIRHRAAACARPNWSRKAHVGMTARKGAAIGPERCQTHVCDRRQRYSYVCAERFVGRHKTGLCQTCIRGLRAAADAAGRAGVAVGRVSRYGTPITPQLCHASPKVPCASWGKGPDNQPHVMVLYIGA